MLDFLALKGCGDGRVLYAFTMTHWDITLVDIVREALALMCMLRYEGVDGLSLLFRSHLSDTPVEI